MFSKILLMIITMISAVGHADAGVMDSVTKLFTTPEKKALTMKVLIIHDQPAVLLEVSGKYKIFDPNTNHMIGVRNLGKKRVIEAKPEGLKWGEEFPGLHQLKIVPELALGGIKVDGVDYIGAIYIYDIGGSVSIVSELGLDNYLMSTLTPQFTNPIPREALSAIVIAARTNALYEIENPRNPFWNVDAKKVGYYGAVAPNPESAIQEAIRTTRDMVMSRTGTYEGVLTPFPAQWGSVTGGQTQKNTALFSRITLYDAEELANKGKDAAEILSKAFPGSHIELVQK